MIERNSPELLRQANELPGVTATVSSVFGSRGLATAALVVSLGFAAAALAARG